MRSRNQDQAATLVEGLGRYSRDCRALPGVSEPPNLNSFVEQLIESIRRVQYVSVIRQRDISRARTDPTDPVMFDPLRAAIVCQRGGEIEEAFWLVFLFVHFGKHRTGLWRYVREIYGRFGEGGRWDWRAASEDPSAFRAWLHEYVEELKRPGVPGGFGNHRKYESLDAYSSGGTGAVVESYVGWVMEAGTHRETVERAVQAAPSAHEAFDFLYRSMAVIARFGRTAKFDYLAMLGKLGLARIEPGSAYLQHSNGPLRGARLLFTGTPDDALSPVVFDGWLVELGDALGVGMQVLEDALCNWQKSPTRFQPFRG